MSRAARGWVGAIAVAAGVVVADQATKQLAAAKIDGTDRVSLGLGFELADVRNRGIAFGLLEDGQGLVVAVTTLALVLVVGYFALDPSRPGLWAATGLLCGGALGNLADRLREDEVIDFLDPPLWPAFNLADVAIVAGIAAIVVLQARPRERDAPRRS